MLKIFARAVNVLFALYLALGAGMSTAAQVAASIEYDYVERPGGLPEHFVAATGTSLKFLSIKAIDGFLVRFFVRLSRRSHAALAQQTVHKEDLVPLLHELKKYAEFHFASEENYMHAIGYSSAFRACCNSLEGAK